MNLSFAQPVVCNYGVFSGFKKALNPFLGTNKFARQQKL